MQGIACAGNWIFDHVKFVDAWPQQGTLSTVRESAYGIGGSPGNVLTDLSRLGFPGPTLGIGCVGDDEFGGRIRAHCERNGIQTMLTVLAGESTSYTDVITVASTGRRTFFHNRGANALFAPQHVNLERIEEFAPRIFHLGYLMLLDTMDGPDDEYGTVAARLLSDIKSRGIETSIDVVSEAVNRFREVVRPALRFTDHCIINEYEAERITAIPIRPPGGDLDRPALARAAAALLEMGVSRTAVIHTPEGAQWADAEGTSLWLASLDLPETAVVSTVGAGDAFCAGILYGIHEGWTPSKCLTVAIAVAGASLRSRTSTDGVVPLDQVLAFAKASRRDSLV